MSHSLKLFWQQMRSYPFTTNALWLALLITFSLGCGQEERPNAGTVPDPVTDSLPMPNMPNEMEEMEDLAFPEALQSTIPPGFELVEGDEGPVWSVGDINGDGLADAAMMVRKSEDFDNHSAVVVALGRQGGAYAFHESTGNLGLEPLQYTDPDFVMIEEGYLYIAYQSMRWGIDLVFDWREETHDLRLVSSKSVNMGNADLDGAGTCQVNYVTGTKTSAYQHWSEEKGEAVMETPRTESVSKVLRPLSALNDDLIYELQ